MKGSRLAGAGRVWSGEIWLLLQATAAATVAWAIARQIGDHSNPFFAPIAAVVALSFARGERGLNALWLLAGVGIGITTGEFMVVLFGGDYWSMALAIFLAVVLARALGPDRLLRNQAAAAAILTVAAADGQAGLDRLLDALIGAAVALIFTQIVFTPVPVGLVRRAEKAVITSMRDGLQLIASAVERGERDLDRVAAERMSAVRDQLSELTRAQAASRRVVRHSLLWRSQRSVLEQVIEDASRLNLLGTSCVMLIRTAIAVDRSQAGLLLPPIRGLASVLEELVTDLDDVEVRQRAVDRVHDLLRQLAREEPPSGLVMAGAMASLQMVAYDLMVFAGIDRQEAAIAMNKGIGELRVTAPAKSHIWRHRRRD